MGRLIDEDKLIAKIEEIYDGYMLSEDGGVVPKDFVEFLEEAPTVEAISKAEYEARLKADLEAILVELQLKIEEYCRDQYDEGEYPAEGTISNIIQQKIDSLKRGSKAEDVEVYDKDTVAWMFRELQLEIEELDLKDSVPDYQKGAEETRGYIADLIQQKIDKLKGREK